MSIFEGGKFRSFIPSMNKNNTTIEKNHHLYKKKICSPKSCGTIDKKKNFISCKSERKVMVNYEISKK
jgi:hypothetical protein